VETTQSQILIDLAFFLPLKSNSPHYVRAITVS
jgi:hypothetical protein